MFSLSVISSILRPEPFPGDSQWISIEGWNSFFYCMFSCLLAGRGFIICDLKTIVNFGFCKSLDILRSNKFRIILTTFYTDHFLPL